MTTAEPLGDPFGETFSERFVGRFVGAGGAALALMALLFWAPAFALVGGLAVYLLGIPLSFGVEALLVRWAPVSTGLRALTYLLAGAVTGAWVAALLSLREPVFAIWLLPWAMVLGAFAGVVAPLVGLKLEGRAAGLVGGSGPAALFVLSALI